MKMFVTTFAVAAAIGAPALAKSHQTISSQVAAAQAYVPSDQNERMYDPSLVVVNGQIVGRDPDPNVRTQLMRDPKPDAP